MTDTALTRVELYNFTAFAELVGSRPAAADAARAQRPRDLEHSQASAPQAPPPHRHLIEVCAQKAVDSLLMLAAAWSGTKPCAGIRAALPPAAQAYPGDGSIKLVFLIDIPEDKRELLIAIRDELNARLEGELALFGIKVVTVASLEVAQRMGLPVRRAPTDSPPNAT